MVREALHLLTWARRIGSISGLLALDAIVLVLIVVDVVRFESTGRSTTGIFRNIFSMAPLETYVDAALVFLAAVLVLPVTLALWRVTMGQDARVPKLFVRRNPVVDATHIVISVAFALSLHLAWKMEHLSGRNYLTVDMHAFESYLEPVGIWVSNVAKVFIGSAVLSALGLLVYRMKEGKLPDWISRVRRAIELEYLRRDLSPAYTERNALTFHGGVSPRIRGVERQAQRVVRRYEQYGVGSRNAAAYLRRVGDECRRRIAELSLSEEDQRQARVEIYSGTSRALEVALARAKPAGGILVSPYEHDSEIDTATWYADCHNLEIAKIEFNRDDYERPWGEQLEKVIARVIKYVDDTNRLTTFILSDVCFATGLQIPVSEVVAGISAGCDERQLAKRHPRVIIDGAHAIGNRLGVISLDGVDAYVFSGHKWLAASEPCGILISRERGARTAYDTWGADLPSSTASARLIGSISGALSLVVEGGLAQQIRRSNLLIQTFLEEIEPRKSLVEVGSSSGLRRTCMLALRPAEGWEWRWAHVDGLRRSFEARSANLEVVQIKDGGVPWVRVAFPHFLGAAEARRIAKLLISSVEQ